MRYRAAIVVLVGAGLVAALIVGVWGGRVPLGVPGEWEWSRIRVAAGAGSLAMAGAAAILYAGFAALGMRALGRPGGRSAPWLAGLAAAAVVVQVAIQSGAPEGYGLTKWVTLGMTGSSGYFTAAKQVAGDPWRFWASYPEWITRQDALHIGTHPPGLILASGGIGRAIAARPGLARAIDERLPGSVSAGFRLVLGPMPREERAALATLGAATLLACALTVVPLYGLARAGLSRRGAWAAAALWPVVPSAVMFQPTADTAFPLLSTAALALARRGRGSCAVLSGAVLAVGMQFSLVFLAVGLVVALAGRPGTLRSRAARIALIGAGFLIVTLGLWWLSGANPFGIWWSNARNHARFYEEFPRSRLAWAIVNPIELAVALGLPCAAWAAAGLGRGGPAVSWATLFVLAVLTLGGRNLSEVARLWLPFFPAILVAAGRGFERLGAGPVALAGTVVLAAAQVLALQAMIQVVYPV